MKEIANIYFDTTKEPTDLFLENGLAGSFVVRENTILLNCRSEVGRRSQSELRMFALHRKV